PSQSMHLEQMRPEQQQIFHNALPELVAPATACRRDSLCCDATADYFSLEYVSNEMEIAYWTLNAT
ncbi:MAG: hypothetical protein KDA37_18955, partial [Planctomycetales bacterium]|nr:hypothetical protein [Planctomycetales bacterium]